MQYRCDEAGVKIFACKDEDEMRNLGDVSVVQRPEDLTALSACL